MTLDLNLYRKLAGSYQVDSSRSKEILDFAKQSDKIWDSTISEYDLLAPTKRGDDIQIIDFNKVVTTGRGVFNYRYGRSFSSFREGLERLWAKKDSIKDGYYVKKTTADSLDEMFIVDTLTRDKFIFENAYVKRCNAQFVYSVDSVVYSYPCAIKTDTNLGLDQNNPIDFSSKKLIITIQKNTETIKIKEDSRVIFGDKHTFKVANVDDYSRSGLLEISLLANAFNPSTDKQVTIDSKQYWIANYTADPTPIPVGSELIITPDVNYVKKTNTSGTTFTVNKYTGGVLVPTTFTFTVDSSSTAILSDYTMTVINGNSFNIKSNVANKKLVINCNEVGGTLLSKQKTINLMEY